MKIVDKPTQFFDEQSKMQYTANQPEGGALHQIQLYIDTRCGDLKLELLEKLFSLLHLAFRDQDIQATANGELSKL
jgi:hypothetical protein